MSVVGHIVVLSVVFLCSGFRSLLNPVLCFITPLRKHAYSNILKILPPKNENFQKRKSDFFIISAQNTDCGFKGVKII